ncbi:hypothetical protein H5410_016797 [Solanum commersonii]|uniref:Retrotransposon gag domain-containing protein n=1 Tax=Solanum commersonii TaxID=4109 RepID=A0A9J5ZX96_SOLCO|nr:hypothetical protein H5410_016797 [Solanum commersonii]
MEDQKLRIPYDSINPRKDLWSKEMSGIRSILQGLVGKIATVRPQNKVPMYENRDLSPAPPIPKTWIFQAEHYFEFYEIAEKYKLSLASLYLDGEALEWYQWLFWNKHFTVKVTSVIDYQSHFEDVLSGYGDFNQYEGNNKTNVSKVFDDLSERPTDANSIDISCKLSQLEVKDPHNATNRENDVKSEDKNDEEEIVTIRDGKKLSSIPSTFSYPNLITRGITSRLGHDVSFLILNFFPPDQFGLEFPFDPGTNLLFMYYLAFCVASSDLGHDKYIISTLRNSCNWVDIRQKGNIYDFLLSKSRENVMDEKVRRVLQEFVESYSKKSPNILVNRVIKL